MDERYIIMVMGFAVLLAGAIFMVAHYRREHRRTQLLRQMDRIPWHRPHDGSSTFDSGDRRLDPDRALAVAGTLSTIGRGYRTWFIKRPVRVDAEGTV
ncbi:hypothetical protein BG60_31650 [Caballeronia zhejiangensis]|uniref:Uncharacterized protein n=1 Tax=Caballeronia zhejiangensis TaxID=871203 RepID=A0A656Q8S2_9BURK|nr:hypothetical protein BURK_008501 [Burkholderia sp. SJ98]KAK45403.1 hypothetical protein BG58_17655 [Caballeronia jiangsuensis]KDR24990.1 hypothetical protein BG60_31650 [Caballeronia zhejiangensis]